VRRELGLQTSDKVDFVADEEGGFRMVPVRKDMRELRGRFAGRAVKPVSIGDMADAIEAEVAQRHHGAARARAQNADGKR
jgi:antitoxin PrlF